MFYRYLLLTIILGMLAAPVQAENFSGEIVGLVGIKKLKRTHWHQLRAPRIYSYAVTGSNEPLNLKIRLKDVPDMRIKEPKKPVVKRVWHAVTATEKQTRKAATAIGPYSNLVWGSYPFWSKLLPR